ncbi:MAG: hypothetical protein ACOX5Z_02760 [Desulfobulbus sp.]|jgi:hypothetical protein
MLVVERNSEGEIVALRNVDRSEAGALEPASLLDNEVIAFLHSSGQDDALAQLLSQSDSAVARVVEDLIDLLIAKNIILFTDLPVEAQRKIHHRKQLRARMVDPSLLVDDIL